LATFEARFELMLLVILMNTGEPVLTALRVVAFSFGLSMTFGRLRLSIGDGCWFIVYVWGGVGIGGRSASVEGRGELRVEGAYVVTLNREGGWTYDSSPVEKETSLNASRKLRSIVPAESFCRCVWTSVGKSPRT